MQAAAQRCLLCLVLAACGPAEGFRQQRGAPTEAQLVELKNASSTRNSTTVVKVEEAGKMHKKLEAQPAKQGSASSTGSPRGDGEEAKEMHKKLEVVATGLERMLNTRDGELAKAKVAPAMQAFVKELRQVLRSTNATDTTQDPATVMKKLRDASAGLALLVHELTARQEALMREDETQHESLLLGVLLTKQQQPMEKQLEVLRSPDFESLAVSKALLAAHNNTKALYLQVADFLDKHKGKPVAMMMSGLAADRVAKVEKLASALERRVDSMENELKLKEASYHKRVHLLEDRAGHATSKSEKHLAEMLKKREVRSFKKFALVRSRDIASMKSAVEAVKHGNVKALQQAKAALEASMQALTAQHGGFLVLLSLGHRTLGADCPYCAAQCIDKCRQIGQPYVKCLGNCEDAGKGA